MELSAEFSAVVLAGDREPHNPVAEAAGVPCKVLAPVGGIPMIQRVVTALERVEYIKRIVVCGPDRDTFSQSALFQKFVESGRIEWLEAGETPSISAWKAMKRVSDKSRILLTTGDHALLSPEIVDFFCRSSLKGSCDVTVALSLIETVTEAFPHTRRTYYRLKDGSYCSCNLFSFLTPNARNAALFWRRVEKNRKHPLKVIGTFGWIYALKYLAGILPLSVGMERISACLGCRAGAVIMPCPEAAVDVDTPEDLYMVSRIADSRGFGNEKFSDIK